MNEAERQAAIAAVEAEINALRAEIEAERDPRTGTEKAIDTAAKTMDMSGAPVRRMLAPILGYEDVLTDEEKDPKNILDVTNPKMFPGGAEILKRKGMEEGTRISDVIGQHAIGKHIFAEPGEGGFLQPEKGGALDVSARGALGTGYDMLTDIGTLATLGGKTAAGKVLANQELRALARGNMNRTVKDRVRDAATAIANLPSMLYTPGKNLQRYVGTSAYRRALTPLDQLSTKMGKPPISSQLLKDGTWGGWGSISQDVADKAGKLEEKAKGLAKKADVLDPVTDNFGGLGGSKGGGVDMGTAMWKGEAASQGLGGKTLDLEKLRDALDEQIKFIKGQGRKPREHAIGVKSRLYSTMPDSSWDQAMRTGPGAQVRGQMARGIKEGVEAAPSGASPELTKTLKDLGSTTEDWGQFLTIRDKAAQLAGKEARTPLVSGQDAMLGGQLLGLGGMEPLAQGMGFKKGFNAYVSTPAQTLMGVGLDRVSKVPVLSSLPDAWLRQSTLQDLRDVEQAKNPWTKKEKKKNEDD